MKTNFTINSPKNNYTYFIALLTLALICIRLESSMAQIHFYGDANSQHFTHVIPDGSNFYVLGREGHQHATISRFNSLGACLWVRELDSESFLTDGIVTPTGLLFIGVTLTGFIETPESIIGQVDIDGNFSCVNRYDSPGNESMARLEEINPGFYVAVGYHTFTMLDVVIYTISTAPPGCMIVQKQQFASPADDLYGQDILVPLPGTYMVCGKDITNSGVIYHYDLNQSGIILGGVHGPAQYSYVDLELTTGSGFNILAAANSTGSDFPYIARFDQDLSPVWEQKITGIHSISQIITDSNGYIYVVGNAIGINRYVVIKIDDKNGTSAPSLYWPNGMARYLDLPTSSIGGSLASTSSGLVYADGRTYSNGYGQEDYFLAITNADLLESCTEEHQVDLINAITIFDSPAGDSIFIFERPSYEMEQIVDPPCHSSTAICTQPCHADYTFQYDKECGFVYFTNLSTGAPNLTYCWDFDNNGTCESTALNPTWQFPPCHSDKAVLTVTAEDGCTDTYWQTISTAEFTPPVISCPDDVSLSCEVNTLPNNTGVATAIDNCTPDVHIDYDDHLIGTAPCSYIIERTWSATDECNNVSYCTQFLTVEDNTPPVIINCPPNVTVTVGASPPCRAQVNVTSPTASDNCSPPVTLKNSFNNTTNASGLYPTGTTVVTWTATDACGNTSTCTFSVTVNCTEVDGCCPKFSLVQLGDIMPCNGDTICLGDTSSQFPMQSPTTTSIACKNVLQTYYIIPNLPGFTYTWSITGGTLTSLQGSNPGVITWGNGSQGFFKVIISDATGSCRDTVTHKVCLIDAPVAAFTVSPGDTICTNQPVTFTNATVGATGYTWDFGDHTGWTSPNPPPHSYTTPGTYTVVLTVTNNSILHTEYQCGCLDTATAIITVLAGEGPTITSHCKQMLCPGDTTSYCVNSGCAPYNWTVNGGTIIANNGACITVQWNATIPATLPSLVSVTTGCGAACGNAGTLNVPVLWNALPISGPTPVCIRNVESYSLPTMPGTFYSWTVTGAGGMIVSASQNTPTINVKWNGPVGTGTIICNYNNPYSGCSGTDTLKVDVKREFIITGPSTVCAGNQRNYSILPAGTADWTISPPANIIGGTNDVTTLMVDWITPGNYTITATADPSIFCNRTATFNVLVNPVPVVNITGPPKACPDQAITYTASSNLPGTNFNWTVVGGTASPYGPNNSNASVVFTGTGQWTLTATQDVNNCSGTNSITIDSEPVPTLNTTPITTCIGGKTNVVVLSGNGPFTWSTSPAATLISAQGASSAMYEIHGTGTITVSNCGGPSMPINVSATPPPIISITPIGSLCAGDLQLWVPSGGPGTTYLWFGGSSATTQTNDTIPVTTAGTYTVQVTFPGGCISVATFTVLPVPIPAVSISTGDPLGWCVPGPPNVNLQAYTFSSGCTYQWFDGSGLIPGEVNPTFNATYFETFHVEVTCGCVARSNSITVHPITCIPTAGGCSGVSNPFGQIMEDQANPATMCNPKKFKVNVNGCTGSTVSWNFGDGTPSVIGAFTVTGVNDVTHHFTSAGAFLVTATITCSGCEFVAYTNVNIPVSPDFSTSVVCGTNGSNTITYQNTSKLLGGWSVTSVTWTSSCGTLPTGSGDTYVLNTTSFCPSPSVTMVITVTNTQSGQICTDSNNIVLSLPSSALSILVNTTVCKNEQSNFSTSMPNIIQYAWTVNNGNAVSQYNPLNYSFNGTPVNPVVGLTVTNTFGCTFTASTNVNVVTPRTLSIAPVEICPNCLPPDSLTATPSAGFTNFKWYHDGLLVGTNPTYQLCQFDASGNYYVTAEDMQSSNCRVTSNTVPVVYLPKPRVDILGPTAKCVPAVGPYIFSLNNAGGSNGNYTYNWSATGPGGVTFTPNNLQYNTDVSVTQLGTYQFILMVTDTTTGCMAKDTHCVYLFPDPSVIVSGPGGNLCEGIPHMFTAIATPPANYTYLWSNGVTGQTMTTSLAGGYSVTATNTESGCYGTSNRVFISLQPITILFPLGCDTICDSESIIPPLPLGGNWPGNISGYSIQWFIKGNPTPFYTGDTLVLANFIASPLVYDWNDIYVVVTYNGCSTTSNIYNLFIEKCCVCTSDLFLGQGGSVYPVFCDPHMGFIPSLPCPADDIFVSGFFGFTDPVTGDPCAETVIWELLRPNNITLSGIGNNYSVYFFLKDMVEPPGTYCLTLTTISPTGDTCVCKVTWIQEPCACCTTLQDFCDRIEDNVILTADNDSCKATLDIGNLNGCDDYIEWVDWNYPGIQEGPFFPGTMAMHSYTASGTYTVCYLAIEKGTDGFICFEKVICDTITVDCPDCFCGEFSGLFFPTGRNVQGVQPFCGGDEVTVECPPSGQSILFTGLFQCAGTECPTAQVSWDLYRLPNSTTPIASGNENSNPYFSINILPAWYGIPGSYELRLTGHCGGQECPCIIRFRVDCPEPCPCDVSAFQEAVGQGFTVVQATNSCQACFSPVALSDCETIKWYLNSTNGTPIGTSVGNSTFCYAFNAGTYTVIMVVNRKNPDGTDCQTLPYAKTVSITCFSLPDCNNPAFRNPTFSDSAVAGMLGLEGMSQGWTSYLGNPEVIEGQVGGSDGWTMQLWGNLNTASVLTSTESMCLARGEGTFTLRIYLTSAKPWDWLKFQLLQGDNFELNSCNEIDCYELASISLSGLNLYEWYDLQIPYDMSQWLPSCGNGVLVRPVVYVTNGLISDQGGEETYSVVHLDQLCVNGTIVALHETEREQSIRIFPNPTSGSLHVELPFPTQSGMSLQIVNLTGQVLLEKKVETGIALQTIDGSNLSSGMYLVQVMSDGRVISTKRFVKM